MLKTSIGVEELISATIAAPEEIRRRRFDREARVREAERLRRDPYGNLAALIESSLHRDTEDYLIVTDLESEQAQLRRFLSRHFFAFRALRARLLRDSFTRSELKETATGWFGRITPVDIFRYIARESGGAAAVSLHGKAAVFLLPGYHEEESARASVTASSEAYPVIQHLAPLLDPDLLSFVIRLHVRHEGAHSEDGMQHRAGLRNRYSAEPESDAIMTLFARRDAAVLGTRREETLEGVALLRELAGENYFFSSHAIRHALQVDPELLIRMTNEELARLGDAIADAVVPSFEILDEILASLSEMWRLTRDRSMNYDPEHPAHDDMRAHLENPWVRSWLHQTSYAFLRFELSPEEHGERVIVYAQEFYGEEFHSIEGSREPGDDPE